MTHLHAVQQEADMRTYTLRYAGRRPTTMNGHRRLHPHARAADDRQWRHDFGWLARMEKVPALGVIRVQALPTHKTHASPQDVAACAPAVKAAIDGLVDAGVVPDDDATHVTAIEFCAPLVNGADGLILRILAVA